MAGARPRAARRRRTHAGKRRGSSRHGRRDRAQCGGHRSHHGQVALRGLRWPVRRDRRHGRSAVRDRLRGAHLDRARSRLRDPAQRMVRASRLRRLGARRRRPPRRAPAGHGAAQAAAPTRPAETPLSALPYTPSLDVRRWTGPPIPAWTSTSTPAAAGSRTTRSRPTRPRWNVYGKLAQDNQRFLWGILESLAKPAAHRNAGSRRSATTSPPAWTRPRSRSSARRRSSRISTGSPR